MSTFNDSWTGQWAYANSPDSEHWYGPYKTRDEAAANGISYFADDDCPEENPVWISPCRPVTPEDEVDEEDGWTFMIEGVAERVVYP